MALVMVTARIEDVVNCNTGVKCFTSPAAVVDGLGTLGGLRDRSAAFEFRNIHRPYFIRSGLESKWVTATPAAIDSLTKTPK
jgi:hypothetical protein